MRTVLILICVLSAAVICGTLCYRGCSDTDEPPRPKRYTHHQIEEILTRHPRIGHIANRADLLDNARRLQSEFPQHPEALYLSLQYLRIHLAYSGEDVDPSVLERCQEAESKLVAAVTDVYRRAWLAETNEDWDMALREFELIQQILPVHAEPLPDPDNELLANVREHIMYTRRKMRMYVPRHLDSEPPQD